MKRRDILKLALLSGLFSNFSFIQAKNQVNNEINGYFGIREFDTILGGIKKGQSYIITYEFDNNKKSVLETDIFKSISKSLNFSDTDSLNNDISITLAETIKNSIKNSNILVWSQGEEFSKFFRSINKENLNYLKLTFQEEMNLINKYLNTDYIKNQKKYFRSRLNEGYSIIYLGYVRLYSISNFVKFLDIDKKENLHEIKCTFSKYLVDDFAKPGNQFIPYKIVNMGITIEGINYNTKLYYNIIKENFENKHSL